MYPRRFLFLAVSIVFIASLCSAQSALLDLPRKSQNAELSQTIGITEVTLKYSRPLASWTQSLRRPRSLQRRLARRSQRKHHHHLH